MQSNHASALRGLSIAVVIIAGLTILACIIGFVFLGVGGSYLANMSPDAWEYYLYDGDYYDYGYGYDYDYYGVDGSDIAIIMGLLVGMGGIALFWELALSAVGLVAGILGLRNYQNLTKMNLVFGWSLAGAIAAFLSGNMVTMVLLIIMCVFAHKDKQLAATQPIVITQPVQPVQPVQPTAPVTTAQPAQPAQPVASAQPVAPAQPATPAQPVAPEAAQPATSETVSVEEVITPTAIAEEVSVTEEPKTE